MAKRTKETKTTEQKINDIIAEITKTEEHLVSLKTTKKELENILEQEKIEALLTSIKNKKISLDQAKEIFDNM